MSSIQILAVMVITWVMILTYQIPSFSQPPASPAAQAQSIRQEIEKLDAQIREKQTQMVEAQQKISDIERQLEIQVEQYKESLDQLSRIQTRQEEVRLKAVRQQNELEKQQKILSERIVALYKQGGYNYIEIILNSASISDLFSRIYFVTLIARQDSEIVSKIESKKVELESIQAKLSEAIEMEQQALYQIQIRKMAIEAEHQKLITFKESLSSEIRALLSDQEKLLEKQRELYAKNIGRIVQDFNLPVEPGSVVTTALQYLGIPYRWGGEHPDTGFDCSGLMRYVFLQHGINLPHYSGYQFKMGKPVDAAELQPGDLVFFGNPIHHVGMYVGNGYFLHAPRTGDFVKLTLLSSRNDYAGARRIIGYVETTQTASN